MFIRLYKSITQVRSRINSKITLDTVCRQSILRSFNDFGKLKYEMYHIYLADFVNIYNIALYNLLFIVEAILQSDL